MIAKIVGVASKMSALAERRLLADRFEFLVKIIFLQLFLKILFPLFIECQARF
jgi:hypothetical protein